MVEKAVRFAIIGIRIQKKGWQPKMKKRISFLYELCVCLAVVCLVYLFSHSKNELFMKGSTQDYRMLEQHSYVVEKDSGAPVGIREIYQIDPSEIPAESNALIFRTVHQNADVYIDNKLVFRLKKDAGTPGGRSPGSRWNTALILAGQQEKKSVWKYSRYIRP